MNKLFNRISSNTESNLIPAISASTVILIVLLILNYTIPEVLQLETRWIIVSTLPLIISLLTSGKIKTVKGLGMEIEVSPSKFNSSNSSEELDYNPSQKNKLPSDYYYINHTSFLREDKQAELQKDTGLNGYPLYDIRVKVFSYYRGAMEKVEKVEYYLHNSYKDPVRESTNKENNFELKELAYGEYVLSAKVFMKGLEDHPFILERYVTLWNSGPKI